MLLIRINSSLVEIIFLLHLRTKFFHYLRSRMISRRHLRWTRLLTLRVIFLQMIELNLWLFIGLLIFEYILFRGKLVEVDLLESELEEHKLRWILT